MPTPRKAPRGWAPAQGPLRACLLPTESFLCFCGSFVFFQETQLVVGDRKGGEIGRTEVRALSLPLGQVKVPFEKLPRGLPEPQERWDFPHTGGQAAGLCHWEGAWGEGTERNRVQKQTSSPRKVLDQRMERWIPKDSQEGSTLSERTSSRQQIKETRTREQNQQPRTITTRGEGPEAPPVTPVPISTMSHP